MHHDRSHPKREIKGIRVYMQESPFVINLYKYSTTSKLMLVKKKAIYWGFEPANCMTPHTSTDQRTIYNIMCKNVAERGRPQTEIWLLGLLEFMERRKVFALPGCYAA